MRSSQGARRRLASFVADRDDVDLGRCSGGAGENTNDDPHEQGITGSLEKTSSHRPSGRRGAGSARGGQRPRPRRAGASCGLSGFNPLQEGFHVGVVEDEGAQQFSQYPSTVFACQLDEFRVLGKFPQHNRLLRTVPP